MGKIIVRAATACGALPVEGAAVYINGAFRGYTGVNGYSEVFDTDSETCTLNVKVDGYEDFQSEGVKLYKNATVVLSVMIKSQTRSKNQEKT